MTRISISLVPGSAERCLVRHEQAAVEIVTDLPPDLGGEGRGFSSTDLLAAALGSCLGSSIGPVAARAEVDLDAIGIEVDKSLDRASRRLRLAVAIDLPAGVDDRTRTKLERAAATCIVHRSLSPEIELSVTWRIGPASSHPPQV